jgi:PTS system nitrogen regulatory IIA component
MSISDFLSPSSVLVDVSAPTKTRLLRDLARKAASALGMDPNTISHEILKRENLGSTGLGGGVAIPHAKIPGLKKPFGMLARLKTPIDFDAVDARPVDIVFMLLAATTTESGEQLNALATVARSLRDPKIARNIRHANGDAAIYCALHPEEA